MNGFESAFHFDSLVWDWIIAIYLFFSWDVCWRSDDFYLP